MEKTIICKNCGRDITALKNWETKKGCIWCDAEYHWNKLRKQK